MTVNAVFAILQLVSDGRYSAACDVMACLTERISVSGMARGQGSDLARIVTLVARNMIRVFMRQYRRKPVCQFVTYHACVIVTPVVTDG